MSSKSEDYTFAHLCPDCESELNTNAGRISSKYDCERCGRSRCFDKIRVSYTVVNESGNERSRCDTIDWQGDTPLLAINAVLEEYEGPRGERVKSIDGIKVNTTPPLREEEMGERKVQYEEAGLIVQDISLRVEK